MVIETMDIGLAFLFMSAVLIWAICRYDVEDRDDE